MELRISSFLDEIVGRINASRDARRRVDERIITLLDTMSTEVRQYAEEQIGLVRSLTKIGLALSSEKDITRLLEMIITAARMLTHADAGTLYLADRDQGVLNFEILQNDTLGVRLGGTSDRDIDLPPVPLEVGGRPNHANVSSYVALTGQIVNIPDVYEAEGFDFTGPRKYDQTTGYRSKSMLVIPMQNHENDIIGVLQLLNAKNPDTGEVIPFYTEYVELVGSLASQAAVALTNAQLIRDLKNLLYSFIQSIATAIDAKSPYTRGHIDRVVELTMMIAEEINNAKDGAFADVSFSEDQIEELRIASWLHDVGKITTPEYVVDKRTKLETIFDRAALIETRFDLIAQSLKNRSLQTRLEALQNGADTGEDEKLEQALSELEADKQFVLSCNSPGEFMDDDKIKRLEDIAAKTYEQNGRNHPYLTEDEVGNLAVRKGTLTAEERGIIENHAAMTLKILNELPFPKKLRNVPQYASEHHEKLDGSGYPQGLTKEQMPLQARIMAVADIFEALTAKDRPYKTPMKLSQAVKILGFMKKDNHIDPDVLDLFLEHGLHRVYAGKHLNPEQMDDTPAA